jgi:hypothetical protein
MHGSRPPICLHCSALSCSALLPFLPCSALQSALFVAQWINRSLRIDLDSPSPPFLSVSIILILRAYVSFRCVPVLCAPSCLLACLCAPSCLLVFPLCACSAHVGRLARRVDGLNSSRSAPGARPATTAEQQQSSSSASCAIGLQWHAFSSTFHFTAPFIRPENRFFHWAEI